MEEFRQPLLGDPQRWPVVRPVKPQRRSVRSARAIDPLAAEGRNSPAQILLRRKWIIVGCFFAGAIVAGLLSSLRKPIYQASVALEAQGVNENVLNSRELDPTATSDDLSQPYIATQARILQSTPAIERAILGIRNDPAMRTNPEAKYLTPGAVRSKLKVKTGEINRVLDVTYDSHDPKFAAAMANAIAQAYIKEDLDSHWKAAQRTSDWLSSQLNELQNKVRDSDAALAGYTEKAGLLFSGDDGGEVSEEQLQTLQQELARSQADLVAKQSANEQVQGLQPGSPTFTASDSLLENYQTRLVDLKRQLADLTAVYTPNYFKVRQAEHQIAELEAAVKQRQAALLRRTQSEYAEAQRSQALLARQYQSQVKTVTQQEAKTVNYNLLKREAETNRQIYEAMLQKVGSYNIASAMHASNLRVIEPAEVPVFPYKPNVALMAVLGGIGCFFASVIWALVNGHADRSIRHPGESRRILRLSELGVIPSAKVDVAPASLSKGAIGGLSNGNDHKKNGHGACLEVVTGQRNPSIVAESFRSAHASLLLSDQDLGPAQVIVISSLNPGEGKTVTASNLAIVRSEFPGRVLLIDADRKRPRLHDVFGIDGSFGLGDLLATDTPIEQYPVEDLAQPTWIPSLSVLPRGSRVHEMPHGIYSARMRALLSRLRREYETIIIDTPPLIHLPDARLLGRLSDGLVLVFRAGKSRWDEALLMQQRLSDDGINILGCVLNDWDPSTAGNGYMSNVRRYTYSVAG